ncbi:MAG: nickel pincer cofactor biosynthesis protein LarB [Peptococcaceae bacterium]|nr:nickel pincer cofactor biosynthesis protein LarB [Peptococcaceae bacterium]
MSNQKLIDILTRLREKHITVDEARESLKGLPYQDLKYAKIDHHRGIRCGFPEVIFCQGKKPGQIAEIFRQLASINKTVLGTLADLQAYKAVKAVCPEVEYYEDARCLVLGMPEIPCYKGQVLIISAGTSDIPIAEEAMICAKAMGNPVEQIFDVGVAGIHRLLNHQETIQQAAVIIVVAGMEGALPSVVAGLTDRPVIAVPTSIGYGASFGGLAALLAMLNSCAAGIAVVNIDNGFGAAAMAASINRTAQILVKAGEI